MVHALPQIGDWSSFAELEALQDKQLGQALGRAARSPFYVKHFGRTTPVPADDFAELPMTTKADLHDNYPYGLLAVPPERLATYFESSGSEGRPTPAYYTDEDWQDLADRYARKPDGIHPSDVFLVRTPYALGLAGHLAQAAGRLRGATIVPGDNRSSVIPYSRVVRVLHDLGVTLTWSNPTDCLMWAASARRAGLDPGRDFPNLRTIFVGGEPLTSARRERISQIWGVPVIDEYGCTEIGSLACRCPQDVMHFWADRVKAEVYDAETGVISSRGIGELVLTPLYLEAMPLIRYNIHDLVELSDIECGCGWHLPVIRVLGRGAHGYPVGDTVVNQFLVENMIFTLPIELGVLFWRARAERDRLHIQVEAEDDRAQAVRAAVATAVVRDFGVPCDLEVLRPGSLVPDDVLASRRHSLKPRSLYGPGENWAQALVFSAG
jgi:phenylacetate-CoA ligase